jgi:hypothetical protein
MIKANGQGIRQSLKEVCSRVGDESLAHQSEAFP